MILCWVVAGFAGLQFMIAIFNFFIRTRYPKKHLNEESFVSVLIPARNEEANIGKLLKDLWEQDYRNLEILIYDDLSEDRTAARVQEWQAKDPRVRLLSSQGLPKGWLGKNYACYCLAQEARGDYFLFLDADVRIGYGVLRQTITLMNRYGFGLLSIFPTQSMVTLGERLTVPIMNSILLSLLPLWLTRKSKFASLSAANGQFMLFDAAVYRQNQPHERWKNSPVEDIHIARDLKRKKIPIVCMTGNEAVSCRMYRNFPEAVHGFAKNIHHFFGNSYLLAFLYWLITATGWIVLLIFCPLSLVFGYMFLVLWTDILISVIGRQPVLWNLLLLFPRQWVLGWILLKSGLYHYRKNYRWKDRFISSF